MLETLKRQSEKKNVAPNYFVYIYAVLENVDKTADFLKLAFENYNPDLLSIKVDAIWNSVRGVPKFDALIGNIKYPEK